LTFDAIESHAADKQQNTKQKKWDKSIIFGLVPSSDPYDTKLEPFTGGFEAFGRYLCGLDLK